jgi:hypothetical protein
VIRKIQAWALVEVPIPVVEEFEGCSMSHWSSQQVKEILILYRPGIADRDDPEVAKALAAATNDPELSRWFAEHCALYESLRDKFRQIPVPPFHWKFSVTPARFRV